MPKPSSAFPPRNVPLAAGRAPAGLAGHKNGIDFHLSRLYVALYQGQLTLPCLQCSGIIVQFAPVCTSLQSQYSLCVSIDLSASPPLSLP